MLQVTSGNPDFSHLQLQNVHGNHFDNNCKVCHIQLLSLSNFLHLNQNCIGHTHIHAFSRVGCNRQNSLLVPVRFLFFLFLVNTVSLIPSWCSKKPIHWGRKIGKGSQLKRQNIPRRDVKRQNILRRDTNFDKSPAPHILG